MIISEIRYKQAIERLRFDAEFYLPAYLEAEEVVKRFTTTKTIGELITSITNGVDIREFVPTGIPYLRVGDMKEIFIDADNASKIRSNSTISKEIKLKKGDLLFSRKGTIGITCVATSDLIGSIISTELIRIRLKEVNSYYVAVFFNSKYGRKQLFRISSGAVNPVITRDLFKSVFIPIPPLSFQQKIESLVKESYNKRKKADEKYKEAEELLNKTLGIEKLELKEEKIFETRFDEVENSQRIDADFHKPLFRASLKILTDGEIKKIFSVKKLGEIAKISKGIEVGSDAYVDDGKLFLRVSNITEKEITISDSAEFIREDLFNALKEKYKPIPGEILYTKDATVGVAFPVREDFNDAIISGGIIRIKPHNDLDQYYLALVLNSILCRSQAERHSIGAVIKHYTYSKIKDLLVPIIPEEKQKQISNLIKQSFTLREEAKELLEKAKKEVEEFIEKNNNHNRH